MSRKMIKIIVGALAIGCLTAGGCVLTAEPAYPVAEVEVGPPAPQAEVITPAPGPEVDFLWIPGWWWWSGGHWAWHPGYWGHRPHAGAVWVPHTYRPGPHGWVHGGGYWR